MSKTPELLATNARLSSSQTLSLKSTTSGMNFVTIPRRIVAGPLP